MKQRNFPEWAGKKVEYVEPTQVGRSYGYELLANPVSDEAMQYSNDTITCVLSAEGDAASVQKPYPDDQSASK